MIFFIYLKQNHFKITHAVTIMMFLVTMCSRYSLNHLVNSGVCNFHRAGDIPGNMNHGHNGLDLLHLIPFKSFQSQLVLVCLKHNKIYTVTRVQKKGY